MSDAIVFRNAGSIDVRSIKTFGISAKVGANPIGYFGTGLKYAIAILMRERLDLTLVTGGMQYRFETKEIEQRGKKFEIITMNDDELPFTTELGKNWDLWQAFRELYCNALDEQGDVSLFSETPAPKGGGETWFVVRGDKIMDSFAHRDEIVLKIPERLKLLSDSVEVYDRPSKHIYYRGIRVHTLEIESMFTYNFLENVDLTEDRTLAHAWIVLGKIHQAIARMTDESAIHRALNAPKEVHEHRLMYHALEYTTPSDAFHKVLAREYAHNSESLNRSAANYHSKLVRATGTKNLEDASLTGVETKQLTKSLSALRLAFADIDIYPIRVVRDLGENTLGLADREDRKIVISKRCFGLGTKYLASTILEEYAHLKTGHDDHTRELQTWLFDSICTLVENHITEEPL